MHKLKIITPIATIAALSIAGHATAQQNGDIAYPEETLNWTVAFGPGGGNDLMSRTVVEILNKYDLYGDQDIIVENREGGSGAVGWSFVKNQQGNNYHITSTSGNFIATPLVSNTDWNYADFTPVGLLANDAMFFVVPEDSEFETMEDFVEAAESERLTVGGIGAAGPDRVVAGLLMESADIEFEYVPSQDGGQVVTSLTSGSVDAIVSNPSEVAGQIEAGNFRALGYTEAERSDIYPDVPTFVEQGYDFSFSLPRGVVLPGGVDEEVQEWWIDTMKEVVETSEWKDYLKTNGLSGNTIWGDDFSDYLENTSGQFEKTLKDIGATE
ncbi:Bug family tripartite tricarboxylate transporter substrate binding protein [Halomonas ramblicola]|uniref:Bug family tripartite tricarboxylate transporter substrate binding protein n=1 Tax=Halomonas ramblicola TaxID=747349 RepID=UPI0025B5F4C5|nr:tripartite tricarboxylate transporter substrate binding protein [Halomonas ramblicola]MDN3520150.1 tripartite tricarboxylate transporter substrate binding protein [Halomonas ramblicola]